MAFVIDVSADINRFKSLAQSQFSDIRSYARDDRRLTCVIEHVHQGLERSGAFHHLNILTNIACDYTHNKFLFIYLFIYLLNVVKSSLTLKECQQCKMIRTYIYSFIYTYIYIYIYIYI